MKPYRQFKQFQYRYEELKQGGRTYLYRWVLVFFGYSVRLHHWIGDDVGPHFHDHSFDFISILLKGCYNNLTPYTKCGVVYSAPYVWYSKAEARHRLVIGEKGAWTLLLCGRPYRKWGFWVNNHKWRPLRYFHKYGNTRS